WVSTVWRACFPLCDRRGNGGVRRERINTEKRGNGATCWDCSQEFFSSGTRKRARERKHHRIVSPSVEHEPAALNALPGRPGLFRHAEARDVAGRDDDFKTDEVCLHECPIAKRAHRSRRRPASGGG